MTNTELLDAKIKESGLKKKFLADACGLTPQGFYNCCNNKNGAEFKLSQVETLWKLLKITNWKEREEIFFAASGA